MKEFIQELPKFNLYKPNQGKTVRWTTFLAMFVIIAVGAWRLYEWHILGDFAGGVVAILIATIGGWLAFRAIQMPSFADFLVSVQAEMTKVSWPSNNELYNSTIVVLVVLSILASVLFTFDLIWQSLFTLIGVL